ncbi:MAG: choice-of-anchor V domain-containing protein [Candidatus Thermoplasmatota archaeon]|nr:choice-of-anchor V domain-containing protein [Candidatus Thermoplasmatota archaeon]
MTSTNRTRHVLVGLLIVLFVAGSSQAVPSGIVGNQAEGETDVAKTGCTCHSGNSIAPDDSVTVMISDVPYQYVSENTYVMKIQIIGGPEIGGSASAGFSLRVSDGFLGAGQGYEDMVQNGDGDVTTLTHTEAGNNPSDRSWLFTWTSPSSGSGDITFWLAGNSVNGDGAPTGDAWNRLSFSLGEGDDNGMTRAVFAGNGDVAPPAADHGHVDLHHMGAPFRAHWLGLLGFGAVVAVIVFCGFFLRYGFSRHYEGRSNLIRLRMKHLRRGDQL